ncbi:mitogen-activated protein kinase kinase kinase A isoform X2 [Nematostella vectensis]|uniref:mitogen-activated protein kinase kinase kinase A isoform X2 n=1 Tax=Nematostella vectensis TaxID=45351 RepID=UPI0020774389|nr:mitogen-activated protein kinase kinase kinase A isoform X2 [Nematostella vectensis]
MTNFRALLLKISDELTSENFSSMRFVCRDVIPAGRLEHFRRPIDMFVEFERLNRLDEKNRDFLASILVQIGRPDLRNLLLEITDSTGNVQEKAYQMLLAWQRTMSKKATVQALMDGLARSGRRDLCEMTEEIMEKDEKQTKSQEFDLRSLQENLPKREPQEKDEPDSTGRGVQPRNSSWNSTPPSTSEPLLRTNEESTGIPSTADGANVVADSGHQASEGLSTPVQEMARGKRVLDKLGNYLDPEKYIVTDLLGTGGFGKVYLCMRKDDIKQLYAVKLVDLGENDSVTKTKTDALLKEIKTLRTLNNPFIIKFCHSETEHNTLAMFMEYMPGGSISQLLRDKGPLVEETVRQYVWQILKGLSFLHDVNIIHRDLKGANILLDKEKRFLKLTDFGIAHAVEGVVTSTGVYASSSFTASVYWTSPELMLGERYGKNTDIWSLGCTIIEMLFGKPPLHLDDITNHMQAMLRISTYRVNVPDSASDICKNFLAKCICPRKGRSSAEALLESDYPIPCQDGAQLPKPDDQNTKPDDQNSKPDNQQPTVDDQQPKLDDQQPKLDDQ